MAARSLKDCLPSLPEKPNQLKHFLFSKRSFGKANPMKCSAQSQWFKSWPFLHYDECQYVVFCHTCVAAVNKGKIFSNAFISFLNSYYSIILNSLIGD